VKKILIFIIPVLLIIVSIFSFQAFQKYHKAFYSYSGGISGANRPPSKMERVSDTLAIVLIDGMSEELFQRSKIYNTYKASSVSGEYLLSPVKDRNYLLQELLTGAKPDVGGYLSGFPFGADNLIKVCNDYGLKVVVARSPNSNLVFDSVGLVDKDIISDTDSLRLKEFTEDISKNKYELVIFEFNSLQLAKDRKELDEKLTLISDQFELIKNSLTPDSIFFVGALNPNNKFTKIKSPSKYFHSSFMFYGDKVNKIDTPITANSEDITSTFSFLLGLPQPTGCMGKPLVEFLDLEESDKFSRLNYYIHDYIQNSIFHLSYFEVDEVISEGYYLESLDLLDVSKPTNISEMEAKITSIREKFESFRTAKREKENVKYILISIIAIIVSLALWLIFLPKYWLGYVFGVLLFILFYIFNYIVFGRGICFPELAYFNFKWLLFYILPSIAISSVIVSITLTLISGYVFNVTFKNIIFSLYAAISTVLFLIIIESGVLILKEGVFLGSVVPTVYAQFLIFRNMEFSFLLSFILALMVGVSFFIYWLSVRLERNDKV